MLAARGAASHRLEGASDPDHQPIREMVGVSAGADAASDPSIRARADGGMGAVVILQTTPLVVGVDGTERSRDALALAARLADPDQRVLLTHVHPYGRLANLLFRWALTASASLEVPATLRESGGTAGVVRWRGRVGRAPWPSLAVALESVPEGMHCGSEVFELLQVQLAERLQLPGALVGEA